MTSPPQTATTLGARIHARSQAGTVVEAMPTMPPAAAIDLPDGVDPSQVLWDEAVALGNYTSVTLPIGGRLRLLDVHGDACAGVLLHHLHHTNERLNVADTVKVQWQAYLGEGSALLSGQGRVLATIVADTSQRHDALCGTSNQRRNTDRYGDGAVDGASPNGRDFFALALTKAGLTRGDIAPNINFFKGVIVEADGSLSFDSQPRPNVQVTLRAELPLLVTLVNVPHPCDSRPQYQGSTLRVTAWQGPLTPADDPWRTQSPEVHRAFLRSEVLGKQTSFEIKGGHQ